jgi:hypothetical protein
MTITCGRLNALLGLVTAVSDEWVALAAPGNEMRKAYARVSGR